VSGNEGHDRTLRGGAVLHLCSDFAQQRIYTGLVSNLERSQVSQVVYSAVRSQREAEWTAPELVGIPCHIRKVLAPRHRLLFRSKVRRVTRDLSSRIDLSGVRVVHAHFLYSDGAVALRLQESSGVPYMVAVRNTDLNAFMRYRPDLYRLRDRVLARASRVVFLSHVYRQMLLDRLGPRIRERVACKSVVIPNGVSRAWLEPPPPRPSDAARTLRLLYVGDFSRNKNILRVLEAAALLAARREVALTLVGGGGDGATGVEAQIASGRFPFTRWLGRVDDPTALREIYRRHDVFVMPSRLETFGVVYVEALSQGLPIVHSRGQGVDGYFEPGTVAEAVDPDDPADIAAKVAALADRLPAIRESCVREARRFDWTAIARSYADLYDAVAKEAGAARR
jgi:glycosyltransferase involved in cell wall biosynthesis